MKRTHDGGAHRRLRCRCAIHRFVVDDDGGSRERGQSARMRNRSGSGGASAEGSLDGLAAIPGVATRWGLPEKMHAPLLGIARKACPYSWCDRCHERWATGYWCGCPCSVRPLSWVVFALVAAAVMWSAALLRFAVVCAAREQREQRWNVGAWYGTCAAARFASDSARTVELGWATLHGVLCALGALLVLPLPWPIASRLDMACSGHRGRWHVAKHTLLALPLCSAPLVAIARAAAMPNALLGVDLAAGAAAFSAVLALGFVALFAIDALSPSAFGTAVRLSEHDSERWSFKVRVFFYVPLRFTRILLTV
jgi:hypothetical protein